MPNKNSPKRIASNNKWTNANYDRINIAIPKGRKEIIKAYADAQGQSINAYITTAIEEKIERDNTPGGLAETASPPPHPSE